MNASMSGIGDGQGELPDRSLGLAFAARSTTSAACVMASTAAQPASPSPGWRVFGYPNLFVLDGAAPAEATAATHRTRSPAVAERQPSSASSGATSTIPAWRCPRRPLARRSNDSEFNHVKIPGGTAPPERRRRSAFTFHGDMTGFCSGGLRAVRRGSQPELRDLAAKPKAGNSIVSVTLTITMPDIDAFIVDRNHAGVAVGRRESSPG